MREGRSVSDKSKAPAKPEKGSRRRRLAVTVLVVLGALCIFISTLSVWIRDVALDEDVWAETSSQLLQSENIRNSLSIYLVDQAYASSDAEVRLQEALPEQLKPLAGPLSAQLKGVAYDAVNRALERPRVQELWRSANRALNAQLVAFIEGDTTRLQSTGGAVVLNVDQLVADVAGSGAAGAVEGRVQPIVVLQADQLSAMQKVVKVLKALAFWPLIIGLLLWAAAVYWAGRRRRQTLRNIALSLALMGLLILAILRVVGHGIVNNLVQTESVRPAAADAWTILTSLLAQSAAAGIFIGLIALLGIWFSGPGARATAGRRWLAPVFRDHPLVVHGTLAVLLLLLLAWGPAGTPRRLIGVVIVVILAFVGLEVLRRQTVRDFPNEVGHYDFHWRRRSGSGASADERVESLERLAALHDSGALTDDEYEAEKALLAT